MLLLPRQADLVEPLISPAAAASFMLSFDFAVAKEGTPQVEDEGDRQMETGGRLALAQQVARLSGPDLGDVLDLVRQEEPEVIQYVDASWVFDTARLSNFAARKLGRLVRGKLGDSGQPEAGHAGRPLSGSVFGAGSDPHGEVPGATTPTALGRGKRKLPPETPPKLYPFTPEPLMPHDHGMQPALRLIEEDEQPALKAPRLEPQLNAATSSPAQPLVPPPPPAIAATAPATTATTAPASRTAAGRTRRPSVSKKSKSGDKPRRTDTPRAPEDLSGLEKVETISGIAVYANPDKESKLRISCGQCRKYFRKRTEMVVHIRTHTGDKPLKCAFCPRRYAHPSNLRAHERTHGGVKSHRCQFKGCKRTFVNQADLRLHMASHPPAGQSTCRCPLCNKPYQSRATLRRHIKKVHPGTDLDV